MFLIKNCESHQFYWCKSWWIFIGLILKGIWDILDSVFILAVIHLFLFSTICSYCWGNLQDSMWINNRNKIYFFTLILLVLPCHLSSLPMTSKIFPGLLRWLFFQNYVSFPCKINLILAASFSNMHIWLLNSDPFRRQDENFKIALPTKFLLLTFFFSRGNLHFSKKPHKLLLPTANILIFSIFNYHC